MGKMNTQDWIQTKNTKRLNLYHVVETGDAVVEIVDDKGVIVNRLTIPKRNIFSLIRGLLSNVQRFYRK